MFTMAETAVLSVIASEVARRGLCRLTISHIAVLAGVSRSTVKNAVRQAVTLGILTSEEWRISALAQCAPNTVRITSPEWRTWLRMRDRKRAGGDQPRQAEEARHRGARSEGGGVRSSTTLRITDSFSNGRIILRTNAGRKSGRKGAVVGRTDPVRKLTACYDFTLITIFKVVTC